MSQNKEYLTLPICGSEWSNSRMSQQGGCAGWVRTLPHSYTWAQKSQKLPPWPVSREPEMKLFSILPLHVSDIFRVSSRLFPGPCSCGNSEPSDLELVLLSPAPDSQQPWHYVTALLTSDQSRLPILHRDRKITGGSHLKPFDFLPKCVRYTTRSSSNCQSLPQNQGRTPLITPTFCDRDA